MHEYVKKSGQTTTEHATAAADSRSKPYAVVRKVPADAPWTWLKLGLLDVQDSRYLSLLFGLCFVVMGLGIERAHHGNPAIALGLSAGFLFAGPFLALGLYELSRQVRAGERIDFILSLFSWCRNPGAVGRFALFLSAVMVLWLWLSVTLVDSAGQPGITSALALLAWGALALLVFMVSAVAIPMMLDRPVGTLPAMATSFRCCLANPAALGLWAVLIALIVGISLGLGYWPLLLAGPVLGHATWHAYLACLDTEQATV